MGVGELCAIERVVEVAGYVARASCFLMRYQSTSGPITSILLIPSPHPTVAGCVLSSGRSRDVAQPWVGQMTAPEAAAEPYPTLSQSPTLGGQRTAANLILIVEWGLGQSGTPFEALANPGEG